MIPVALILLTSLLFPGIVVKVKALVSGRKGPGLLQPILDIIRLLRKGNVYSNTTSSIFQIGPTIYFATILFCMFFIPFGDTSGLISFHGDLLLFIYLLGLGKFFLILNALDAGSGFEGMGANREALYSMLVEPAFIILFGTFSMMAGYDSFYGIFAHWHLTSGSYFVLSLLAAYILIQIAMIENSRLPVDDPKTHLELTMVHEVIVLDNSGFDLGLMLLANAFKFGIFGALIANFILPEHQLLWIRALIFIGVIFLFAVIVGLMESFRARLKMEKNPQFILTLSSIAAIAFLVALIISNKLL
ncbi:MAG: NADH-quinone oxidoreductase subunit H [Bacteroidetes bacterium]|nr:NADH-quinone oxidoreductase subunit H [Bacteroidota bacterium]